MDDETVLKKRKRDSEQIEEEEEEDRLSKKRRFDTVSDFIFDDHDHFCEEEEENGYQIERLVSVSNVQDQRLRIPPPPVPTETIRPATLSQNSSTIQSGKIEASISSLIESIATNDNFERVNLSESSTIIRNCKLIGNIDRKSKKPSLKIYGKANKFFSVENHTQRKPNQTKKFVVISIEFSRHLNQLEMRQVLESCKVEGRYFHNLNAYKQSFDFKRCGDNELVQFGLVDPMKKEFLNDCSTMNVKVFPLFRTHGKRKLWLSLMLYWMMNGVKYCTGTIIKNENSKQKTKKLERDDVVRFICALHEVNLSVFSKR